MFLRLFFRNYQSSFYKAPYKDLDQIQKLEKCILMMESKVISDLAPPALTALGSLSYLLSCLGSGNFLALPSSVLLVLGSGAVLTERLNSELALVKMSDLPNYESTKILELAAELNIKASSGIYKTIERKTEDGKTIASIRTDEETITSDTPLGSVLEAFSHKLERLEKGKDVNEPSYIMKKHN